MPAAACMSRPQEMAALLPGLLVLFGFFFVVGESDGAGEGSLSRSSFPPGFIFGTASSAYQYEGAATEGGRGPSIWDTFVAQYPERIKGRGNASVAVDSYHRYKEDVKIMKEMGVDAYRFSISWTRILPNGSLRGGVNKEGIAYYNHLIDELVSHDVQPFVTLFHWDSPQGLEDLYGGFLSPRIISDFVDYAEVCFREFGDRVKHWITFNEPWSFCVVGYARGEFPPGRCSPWEVGRCRAGDSATEPYTAGHHQLLAHAAAVKLYRQKYQGVQKGAIGITLVSNWFVPFRKSKSDEDAAQRGLDFMLGWFMDPLTQGDYPFSMRALVGDRLPRFTVEEAEMVKGSFDFIGLNYYTAFFAMALPFSNEVNASYSRDVFSVLSGSLNGTSIGPKAASEWLYVYPAGIREVLLYTSEKYNNPVIYITESGVDEKNNEALTLEGALRDNFRISFYERHLLQVRRAIRKGADVRGFFAWSLLDNFEWTDGYTVRFGLHYVDYRNGLKRHPKSSAAWFRRLLRPSRR